MWKTSSVAVRRTVPLNTVTKGVKKAVITVVSAWQVDTMSLMLRRLGWQSEYEAREKQEEVKRRLGRAVTMIQQRETRRRAMDMATGGQCDNTYQSEYVLK